MTKNVLYSFLELFSFEEYMAENRAVMINENAVKRAEDYIKNTKEEKGINLSIGNVFAMALDEMLSRK